MSDISSFYLSLMCQRTGIVKYLHCQNRLWSADFIQVSDPRSIAVISELKKA
jgi:hypothetical protein